MFEKELETATAAVTAAARLCISVRQAANPSTLQKGDKSPVTVADFGSQALVCRALEAAFPYDPVIAEESASALLAEPGADTRTRVFHHVREFVEGATESQILDWIDRGSHVRYSDRYWTLDPIDGTKGFLRGDQYAVALALVVDGTPVVACLACPNLPGPDGRPGILMRAVRNEGTTCHALFDESGAHDVSVSGVARGSDARFCESFESGHSSHDDSADVAERLGIVRAPARMDSQAKYAVVARGDADLYLRLPTQKGYVEKIWDHAAGSLVVEAAGGRVTDVDGKPLDFTRGSTLDQNRGVVVTNGLIHDEVLAALEAAGLTGEPEDED